MPAPTPFRPTVTSGAALSAPGWLELEVGGQTLGGHRFERRDSLPYLLKYSLDDRFALLLGGDLRVSEAGATGGGDTTVTVKYRHAALPAGWSAGLEGGLKIPTAGLALGTGERDLAVKGIVGVDLPARFHLDTNLMLTRFGAVESGRSRRQTGWAAALSKALGDDWTTALDLSGTRQRGAPSTLQLLAAVSYATGPRVVLDAGLAGGLNRDTPRRTVFAGMTVLLGRLD